MCVDSCAGATACKAVMVLFAQCLYGYVQSFDGFILAHQKKTVGLQKVC